MSGALEETTEYMFRAANAQARLLWQWKIRTLAAMARQRASEAPS